MTTAPSPSGGSAAPGSTASAGTAGGLPKRRAERGKPRRVRPYALTQGRTRFGHVLLVETFIAASEPELEAGEERPELTSGGPYSGVMPEMQAIVELCRRMRTVAEIAALLRMPLGVVRVLLSDLADQGRVRVHGTGHGAARPDRALLERVLGGLRKL